MPILSTEPATSVLWKALPWLSFLPSRALTRQQHPHCLQGQSWALFHVNPMQFSWQGSNTSSTDGGTHHSFSLWGKAGEILGQLRATPEWRSSHCSSPALQPLPTCPFTTPVGEPQRPGNQDQIHLCSPKSSEAAWKCYFWKRHRQQFCSPFPPTSPLQPTPLSQERHLTQAAPFPASSPPSVLPQPPSQATLHPSQQCSNSSYCASALILSFL